MTIVYGVVFVVAFLISLLSIRELREHFLKIGISGTDINKKNKPKVPEVGGLLLLPAIWICTLGLISTGSIHLMALTILFTVTCYCAAGFFDDGFRVFKKEKNWLGYLIKRGIVITVITLPYAYLTSLATTGNLFITGSIAFLGVVVFSSLTNSFAGLNGWEVGSSFMLLLGVGGMLMFSETYTTTLLALVFIFLGAVLALFWFNRYPARIFPGDSGTLLIGSFIGCTAVHTQGFVLLLFLPHLLDIALKLATNPGDISQKKEHPYEVKKTKLHIPKSQRLDFAKLMIRLFGPADEKAVVRRIHYVVATNTLIFTTLYFILKTSTPPLL